MTEHLNESCLLSARDFETLKQAEENTRRVNVITRSQSKLLPSRDESVTEDEDEDVNILVKDPEESSLYSNESAAEVKTFKSEDPERVKYLLV